MSWMAWRVTFRMLSPLHSGWRKIGNLQQTRPYVTGRMLWGALTARLVRDNGGTDYRVIGERVDETLTFTYFYPSTDPEDVRIWPWEETWDEFAWTHLGSYAATALQDGHTAEEGSLHEIEYLAPYTRQGESVFLVGYVFERLGCELKWQAALHRLQLGGERGYGWGRIALHERPRRVEDSRCFGLRWDAASGRVTVPEDEYLLAHADACGGLQCTGSIEPLVGREIVQASAGFGGRHSPPVICWAPGSKVNRSSVFFIDKRGIWQPIEGR